MTRARLAERGAALVLAVVAAGLAGLAAVTALLLAERELRSARAWSAAVRVEAALSAALEQVIARWPEGLAGPGDALGPVSDALGPVEVRYWLYRRPDSTALLVGTASLAGGADGPAVRWTGRLVRLRPDSLAPDRIGGVTPLSGVRDWVSLVP